MLPGTQSELKSSLLFGINITEWMTVPTTLDSKTFSNLDFISPVVGQKYYDNLSWHYTSLHHILYDENNIKNKLKKKM